jgi:hypothetical protein
MTVTLHRGACRVCGDRAIAVPASGTGKRVFFGIGPFNSHDPIVACSRKCNPTRLHHALRLERIPVERDSNVRMFFFPEIMFVRKHVRKDFQKKTARSLLDDPYRGVNTRQQRWDGCCEWREYRQDTRFPGRRGLQFDE